MSYAAQGNISGLPIGLYLKVYSAKGVYNQLSTASELWKFILKKKSADPKGREHRFNLVSSYGMGAAQFLTVGGGSFPASAPSVLNEGIALFKEYGVTVNVDMDLLDKGMDDLAVYGQPLAEELKNKGIGIARALSIAGYGDGSGAIGHVASAPTVSTGNDTITCVISQTEALAGRSNLSWLTEGDHVKFATDAGVAHGTINNTGDTVAYWRITSKSASANSVTMQPYTSANALINITTATMGATGPASLDYIYRIGITPNDLTAISTNDYNGLSQAWAGLESLTANDGRKVNGITLSGALGGTRHDNDEAVIDYDAFQTILSQVKDRVGKDRYKYNTALMAYGAYDAIMMSGETDRRFAANTDLDRGTKGLSFRHMKDQVSLDSDEFCPVNRIIIPPDSKEVLQFIGRDFKSVNVGGAEQFMPVDPTTGMQLRTINSFMQGSGTLVCLHAAAIGVVTNFTLPGQ